MSNQKESGKEQEKKKQEGEEAIFKVPTSIGIKKRNKKQKDTQKANSTLNTNTTSDKHKDTTLPSTSSSENKQNEESEEFSFDESGEDISHESSDLSSCHTEEERTSSSDPPQLPIKLDSQTHDKLIEKVKKNRKDIKSIKHSDRGVIYLGHIPFGFFENEMKKFFSQFGFVTRLRLARNKKTGHSKHYAFIEFMDSTVAKIVAETMNGYIMYSHVLDCHVVPPEKVHPKMFYSFTMKKRKIVDKAKTPEQIAAANSRDRKADRKRRKMLHDLGIDYEYPEIKIITPPTDKTNTEATPTDPSSETTDSTSTAAS